MALLSFFWAHRDDAADAGIVQNPPQGGAHRQHMTRDNLTGNCQRVRNVAAAHPLRHAGWAPHKFCGVIKSHEQPIEGAPRIDKVALANGAGASRGHGMSEKRNRGPASRHQRQVKYKGTAHTTSSVAAKGCDATLAMLRSLKSDC